jgi:hypothetical protein
LRFQESKESSFQSDLLDTLDDLSVKSALRDIGKRLKNGDDRAEILRSYGATSGRANQEIGAVIDAMIEQIESEKDA